MAAICRPARVTGPSHARRPSKNAAATIVGRLRAMATHGSTAECRGSRIASSDIAGVWATADVVVWLMARQKCEAAGRETPHARRSDATAAARTDVGVGYMEGTNHVDVDTGSESEEGSDYHVDA